MIDQLGLSMNSSESLFNVHFAFDNTGSEIGEIDNLNLNSSDVERSTSIQYELELEASDAGNCLEITFSYCTDLYDYETIELFINYYRSIIDSVLTDDTTVIGNIDVNSCASLVH